MSDDDIDACLRNAVQAADSGAAQAAPPAKPDRGAFERGAAYGLRYGLNFGRELLRSALQLAFAGSVDDVRRFLALAIPTIELNGFPLEQLHFAERTSADPASFDDDRDIGNADRVERALLQTVGPPGRMITFSKADFQERHPDRLVVFNGNLVLSPGTKVWHGDVDLSVAEPQLHELARLTGRIVFLLDERDARFENEKQPVLENAVFSVTPTGHTRYQHRYIERSSDGVLRRRLLPSTDDER